MIQWDGGFLGTGTNWHEAENWVGDVLPGPTDDVEIGAAFADAAISSDSDVTVNALSSQAALFVTGGVFSVGADSTIANDAKLSGGAIGVTSHLTVGGIFTWHAGTIRGGGQLVAGGGLTVSGDATHYLDASTLVNVAAGAWTGGDIDFSNGAVLSNSLGATLELLTSGQPKQGSGAAGSLVNAGTIRKSGNTAETTVGLSLSNSGVVEVQDGVLTLSHTAVSNAGGTIAAHGATVRVDNTQIDGGSLIVSDDASSFVEYVGDVTLNSVGWVDEGAGEFRVYQTTARLLGDQRVPASATLVVETTAFGVGRLVLPGSTFSIEGSLELRGHDYWGTTGASLWLESHVLLAGSGRVLINSPARIAGNPGASLTVGSNQRVSGWGTIEVDIENDGLIEGKAYPTLFAGDVTNRGTIRVSDGGTCTFQAGVANRGTLEAAGSGTRLSLSGVSFDNTGGLIRAAGAVVEVRDATVSGGSLVVSDDASSFVEYVGDVTLNSVGWVDEGAGEFRVYQTTARLLGDQRVPASATLVVETTAFGVGRLVLPGSTFSNEGSLELRGHDYWGTTGASLWLESDVLLAGSGRVLINSPARIAGNPGAALTVGSNQRVSGWGTIEVDIENDGLIECEGYATFFAGMVTNYGTIRAANGGSPTFQAAVVNRGTLEAVGSGTRLSLSGVSFDNTGGLIRAAGAVVEVRDATVSGGGLVVSDDASSFVEYVGDVTLNSVSWVDEGAGEFRIPYRASARLLGDQKIPTAQTLVVGYESRLILAGGLFTNDGTLALESGTLSLYVESDATLSGNGVVFRRDSDDGLWIGGTEGVALTVGPGQTIRQPWRIDVNVVNEGLIEVDGQTMLTFYGSVENRGAIRGVHVATVVMPSVVTNSGLLESSGNSALRFRGSTIVNAGGTIRAAGGLVELANTCVDGGTLVVTDQPESLMEYVGDVTLNSVSWVDEGAGEFRIPRWASARLLGDQKIPAGQTLVCGEDWGYARFDLAGGVFTNDGTLETRFGATLFLQSGTTFSGEGVVLPHGPSSVLDIRGAEGVTLTVGPGQTIRGDGEIQVNVVNGGLIEADQIARTLKLTGSTRNDGVLSAVSGGIIEVSNSVTNTGAVRAVGDGKVVFNGSFSTDNSGSLSTDPSGTVSISGDLLGSTTNVAEYHNEGTVQLDGWADATAPHLFEVMAGDLGGELSGSDHVFTYVSLALGSGNFVRLTDLADNTPGEGAEALYVHHLVVPWGATLDLAGYRVYASATEIQGQILNGVIDPLVEFPRVIAQSPEITSDPVKALRLEFNQPMNEASFTWDDLLSFQGPSGDVIPTAYRWVAPGTLEITFDEQRAMGAAYRMVLGPQLQGSTGHWMDQDGDFIWREDPDDRYTAAFTIAYTGTFSEDRTWSPEDGLIAVDGPLTIAAGATLTIEPGTIVKFTGPQSRIMVEGNLEARGTAAQPVVFTSLRDDAAGGDTNNDGDATSPSRADWSGIYTSATGAHVDLDHAVVRYADYGVEILADNSSWRVSNSVISNNNIGLGAHHRKGLAAEAVNTLIADNWNTGVYFHEYFAGILRNCTIVGNGFAGGWAAAGVHQVGTLIMENCIVAFNRNGFDSNADPNLEIQNSLFYNPAGNELNVASDVLSRNGNIIADPLFVDIDARNYELAARSPAIDAGRGIDAPGSDILDRPRFDDPGMANLGTGYPSYVDIGAFERQDTTQSKDLAVIQVSAPQPRDVGAGDTFTVTWTVENKGQAELSDAWTDAIYLSSDPNLSPGDDYLLATMVYAGGLSLGETYSQTWTGAVPETLAGPQYVLVYTNAQSAFRESKLRNNVRDSQTALAIDVPDLVLDQPTAGSLDQGEWQFYRFEAQAGRTVRFVFDSESTDGAARLYVRCGAPPTASAYDAAGLEFNQPDQEARLLAPVAGEYYVGIFAYRQAGAGAYTLTAQYTTLDIRQASPDQVGKAGRATVKILGDGFTTQSEAQLIGPGGRTIESEEWFQDAATLYATFDLAAANASPGVYDLIVTNPGAESVTASGAVTVVRGGAAQLRADLVVPSLARPGRKIEVRIDYANAGNVDMASPLFTVESTDELTWTVDELRELLISQYSQSNPLSRNLFPPEMFAEFFLQMLDQEDLATLLASLTTQVTVDSVSLLGISKEGPVSILRPGESYSLTLEVKTPFEPGDIPFTLYSFGEPGDEGLSEHIDWDQVETDVRPPDVASDAWAPLFARFQAQIGTTWGDYLAMLRDNADHLAEIGHRVYDAAELASFEFIQAGEMGTPTYLTSHEDAYCPAPGLPLSFERYFLPGPFYRARLGALGRGWTHSYEITLQERSDGSVVINGSGGLDRIFEHDAQGTYQASPGDYGRLERQTGGGFLLTEKHGLEYSFRPDGLFAWIEDPDGNRITAVYDTAGRLIEVVHSSGDRFTFTYDADGRLETLTDHAGRVTRFDYDSSGKHLVSVTRPDGEATTYTYLTGEGVLRNHHLTSIAAPGAPVIHFSYDDLGRLEQYSLGAGEESTTYVYSTAGKTSVADALGHTTTVWLDSDGRPARVENPLGEAVDLHYDAASNLVAVVGPDGTASYLAYDAAGNLVGTQDPMGYVTAFGYDEAYSNLAWVRDARGNMTNYDYDAAGNLASITYADQTVESYGYDASGSPNAWTNRRGQTIAYTYNDRGQLVEKAYPDGGVLTYAYDDAGRLVSAEDAGGATTLQYDPDNGWLTKITYPEGRWLEYEYNDLGQRTQMQTYDGFVTNYRYDVAGRLTQLTDDAGQNMVTYTYDVAGRLIREDKGNETYATYEYDAAGQILDLTNHAPDGAPQSYFRYRYDALGRRTQMATHYGTWTYQYDASGQLTRAVLDSTDAAIPDQDLAYEYDPVGNRIRTIVNGEVTEYTTNDMNQYTEVGAALYSYDADGNLVAKMDGGIATTYTYDFDNRLVGVTTPTETWSYAYDFLGNRVTSAQNGTATEYLIDPWGLGDVVAEYDQAGSAIARYSHGYGLLSRTDATGAPAYYAFDAIGSTSALTDAAGKMVNAYVYDPFGVSLRKSESIANPFEFVGGLGVMDEGNGLAFMRNRYCDPTIGRFGSRDPLGMRAGDVNLYRYVGNDSVSFSDPAGLWGDMIYVDQDNDLRQGWYDPDTQNIYINKPNANSSTVPHETLHFVFDQMTPDMWGSGLPYAFEEYYAYSYGAYWAREHGNPDDALSQQAAAQYWKDVYLRSGIRSINPACYELLDHLHEYIDPLDYEHLSNNGSTTPEDKFGPAGYDPLGTQAGSEQRFIAVGEALDYRIEFWNKPDAPVPTQYAYVEDTLDPSVFDLSTFEFTRFGFLEWDVPLAGGQAFDMRVDLRPDMNIAVDVTAGLDPVTGKVTWAFRCVDPLTGDWPEDPMAGFLPPFNPETGYELGWVEFRVEPRAGLSSGTRIENQAFVEFDMLGDLYDHPAPKQGPWVNTIDAGLPTSNVVELPRVSLSADFVVNWTGHDDTGGSGISTYDVFVSDDGGDWERWRERTRETSATFPGEPGHTYRFYSVARDNVGLEEATPPPDTFDTLTTVLRFPWQNPVEPCDVNGQDGVTPLDVLLIINFINAHPGSVGLPASPAVPPPFYNVNGDNAIVPLDVLLVINYVNSHPAGSGEGERLGATALTAAGDIDAESPGESTTLPGRTTTEALGLWQPRSAVAWPSVLTAHLSPGEYIGRSPEHPRVQDAAAPVVAQSPSYLAERHDSRRWTAAWGQEYLSEPALFDDSDLELALTAIAADVADEWSQ